ncbi:formate hydrogenlyase subunit 3/multisubunit Na+/H+ antiporter MnhD subunit [Aminivibrio pyruvatiphilus]|uniref:Formate hydrogenlyase subunit 3/multisubunit Na+/H+ antiporter MnhD subunit n=1 Tax=Aminivibrio pyruvatiphilus TaxID=1005740 RepID=A0A4R8MBQ9_9BACT|nr:proton-conducting transporter membrane subunit [Aminivibrio pyruvatiphilus]TDY61692.1 formate hydrogenlyase subunit 3/multisubunit Na+/H+ antiporter MnhD subunit [Aminivibrio pyruvatiphilus]
MIFSDYWMLWPIVVPLAAAFVLQVLDYFVPERMEGWIRISAVVTAAAALGASFSGWNAVRVLHVGGWAAELGIILVTDRLSSVFLLVSSLGGAASAWTVFFPFRRENRRFCGLFFILWGALNGILVTGDLFNMYVFFEILAVSAYVLAGAAMTREGLEAGLKYLVLGTVGALFLLMGTALLYMGSGTLNLALLSSAMESVPRGAAAAAAACLLTGLGLKMGMFPFHFWLPDAHSSASTGVSMILSGVVVKASFYALLRIVFLLFPAGSGFFSVPDILLALGVLSLAAGHLSAQRQHDVKRLLAWSTVAHMGYLLIGAGCASPLGIGGALLHALNHGAAKMGLFLGAGGLYSLSGSRNWRSFGGGSVTPSPGNGSHGPPGGVSGGHSSPGRLLEQVDDSPGGGGAGGLGCGPGGGCGYSPLVPLLCSSFLRAVRSVTARSLRKEVGSPIPRGKATPCPRRFSGAPRAPLSRSRAAGAVCFGGNVGPGPGRLHRERPGQAGPLTVYIHGKEVDLAHDRKKGTAGTRVTIAGSSS